MWHPYVLMYGCHTFSNMSELKNPVLLSFDFSGILCNFPLVTCIKQLYLCKNEFTYLHKLYMLKTHEIIKVYLRINCQAKCLAVRTNPLVTLLISALWRLLWSFSLQFIPFVRASFNYSLTLVGIKQKQLKEECFPISRSN